MFRNIYLSKTKDSSYFKFVVQWYNVLLTRVSKEVKSSTWLESVFLHSNALRLCKWSTDSIGFAYSFIKKADINQIINTPKASYVLYSSHYIGYWLESVHVSKVLIFKFIIKSTNSNICRAEFWLRNVSRTCGWIN